MESATTSAAPAAASVAQAKRSFAKKLHKAEEALLPVFAAGATGGLIEGVCVQPLEFLKTRLQLNQGTPLPMGVVLRDALREGGVAQLYRGALPELTGMIPRSTGALASLEFSKRWLRQNAPDPVTGKLQASHAYLAGAVSGVCESLGFAPFQVIKVRMVAQEHLNRYKSSFDCARQLLAAEGPKGLFIGLGPTLWRVTTWNTLYYGTMHNIQTEVFDQHPLSNPVLAAARKMATGMVVGMTATIFNAPFDVIKSRFQSQERGPNQKYRYTLPSLVTIIREEGVRALYKGFLPKALLLGIGQTIGYMVFSEALGFYSEALKPRAAAADESDTNADQ
ncbi:hypothetical protein HYH02_005155 [Chlamydomonas schloesseri]|uniref:Mitochondrial carrier protein n=1 Tax=Chlamydomonas schloesseri TaxID=2026947 RepID=A0A835WL67_9CHLO|nr:hypothetical protein HYH02_005155 [Chlamydomonas schloesseri]|eukprot:KAG2449622.1 hypothetical protein HYH02_005155 [Chlamydomonas schloesseri]